MTAHPPARARDGLRRWLPAAPTLVLGTAMAIQGVLAAVLGNRGWFSGDVIAYFTDRGGLPDPQYGLNDPHEGHWQPVLIVTYRLLFELFGLRSYLPYLLLTVLVHLAVVGLLYWLLRAVGSNAWVACVLSLCVLTFGAGSEVFLVEAPVALTAAIALGLLAALRLQRSDFASRDVLVANGLLLVAVMLSVGGVVASILVGCFALARGWRVMLQCVAAPAAAFVGWFLWRGREGRRLYIEGEEWLDVPRAAVQLLVQPLTDLGMGATIGPAVLLAAVVLAVVGARQHRAAVALGLGGLVAAVAQAVLSAIAQVPFGIDQVLTSRYRYVVLVCLVPLLAVAVNVLLDLVRPRLEPRLRPLLAVAAAVFVALALVNSAAQQRSTVTFVDDVGDETKDRLAGMLAARSTGEPPINDATRGEYISGFDLERLSRPDARSEIPELEGDQEQRIQAESRFFVAVTQQDLDERAERLDLDFGLTAAAFLTSTSFDKDLSNRPGCRTYEAETGTPRIDLTTYNTGMIEVTSDATSVSTTLVRDDLGLRGDPQEWKVDEPGEPLTIATTAQVARLEVTFDRGGTYEVCVPTLD